MTSPAPGSSRRAGSTPGETPEEAAWRELGEETGLNADEVDLVAEYPEWTAYEWPDRSAQERSDGPGPAVVHLPRPTTTTIVPRPDGVEFSAWQWVERQWLVDEVVDFRRPSYRRVLLDDGA